MPAGRVQTSELNASERQMMSTIQERCVLRIATATLPKIDIKRKRARPSIRWASNAVAANAVPIAATLALVWLATVSLVVANYFVPLNLVPLVYMLPVVLAATQWG